MYLLDLFNVEGNTVSSRVYYKLSSYSLGNNRKYNWFTIKGHEPYVFVNRETETV